MHGVLNHQDEEARQTRATLQAREDHLRCVQELQDLERLRVPQPAGPRYLAPPKYPNRNYCEAVVYTIWAHGPLP